MPTFVEIQDRIKLDYLIRDDLVSETKRAIQAAIRHYERKRFWFNETATDIATVAGQSYATLPTDFLLLDTLQITVNSCDYKLIQRDVEWLHDANACRTQGQPTDFALVQNRVELSLIPNAVYALPLHYVERFADLSADASTNSWLSAAEDLIVFRATKLLYATVLKDPDSAILFSQLEREAYTELQSMNEQRIVRKLKSSGF